ncbi:Predicted nucleic acid-binding protein, contains Zn-ribbon domain (includes truncated derivatives) [Micromonospora coriariae]|uniref:Predicted nucleic acid-binding protein, contains Zn-ribbon domain (Includes truncated derivatives) n=1 Tax=Micromonospora coriariae TaxID=285665 RepID=A0A1C4VSA8_9ACTN|nr:Predicted nucleic acid-binding protein, contains Zn-ribbon domain (includes truncated derivatives) [Micromonospora coriariae]
MSDEPKPARPDVGRDDRRAGDAGSPRTPGSKAAGGGDGDGGGQPDAATGPELARAVLDAALSRRQAAARARRTPGSGGSGDGGSGRRLRGYSGPGPDPRDPQPLSVVLNRLVKARGWQQPAAEATVFGAWERVVGAEVAQHSRPVKLENGELTVEARSTAWATQLRLLAGSLLKQIAREVGHNVVRKLHIHGPAAPSWSKGPRRVRGRGPRDTYG